MEKQGRQITLIICVRKHRISGVLAKNNNYMYLSKESRNVSNKKGSSTTHKLRMFPTGDCMKGEFRYSSYTQETA